MGKKIRFRFGTKKAAPSSGKDAPNASPAPTKKASSYRRRRKGPGGRLVEVTASAVSSPGHHDGVSVMTPVTGLPPESPDKARLPSLLPPQQSQQPGNKLYGGYTGTWSPPASPTSSPSRGDMKIDVPQNASPSHDEISVMTPLTGVASPNMKRGKQRVVPPKPFSMEKDLRRLEQRVQRLSPPAAPILEDDDESQQLQVYEDDDGGSAVGDYADKTIAGGSEDVKLTSSSPWKIEAILSPAKRDHLKRKTSRASKLLESKKSWLTSTEYFQKAIDTSFGMVDADKSGDVTLEELYAGLLLIHLKMAVYVGAPACRPASKEYVTEIFGLLDADDSGTLNKEEFATVVKILYSQVFTRIVIHWMLTLMIVPLVSQYIIKYTSLIVWISHEFWKDIDDDLDPLQRFLWKLWAIFLSLTPQFLDSMGELIVVTFGKVPKGVWKSMPYTMLTLAQTSVALPYALNRVEDFFRRKAHKDVSSGKDAEGKLKES